MHCDDVIWCLRPHCGLDQTHHVGDESFDSKAFRRVRLLNILPIGLSGHIRPLRSSGSNGRSSTEWEYKGYKVFKRIRITCADQIWCSK